jgi:hypothetical protein
MHRRVTRSLAAIGLSIGLSGLGVVGSAPPAEALPDPIWYCTAFQLHSNDTVIDSALTGFGPGYVRFSCVASHPGGPPAPPFHCYFVFHNDGVNPADPADDNIYRVNIACP